MARKLDRILVVDLESTCRYGPSRRRRCLEGRSEPLQVTAGGSKRIQVKRINILFVCSKNQWRSPTAEAVYRADERVCARSRGTTKAAVQPIRSSDIAWADVILVMEDKHRQRILAQFPGELKFKPVHVLDIPDDYRFMDAELIELLKSATEPIINEMHNRA